MDGARKGQVLLAIDQDLPPEDLKGEAPGESRRLYAKRLRDQVEQGGVLVFVTMGAPPSASSPRPKDGYRLGIEALEGGEMEKMVQDPATRKMLEALSAEFPRSVMLCQKTLEDALLDPKSIEPGLVAREISEPHLRSIGKGDEKEGAKILAKGISWPDGHNGRSLRDELIRSNPKRIEVLGANTTHCVATSAKSLREIFGPDRVALVSNLLFDSNFESEIGHSGSISKRLSQEDHMTLAREALFSKELDGLKGAGLLFCGSESPVASESQDMDAQGAEAILEAQPKTIRLSAFRQSKKSAQTATPETPGLRGRSIR